MNKTKSQTEGKKDIKDIPDWYKKILAYNIKFFINTGRFPRCEESNKPIIGGECITNSVSSLAVVDNLSNL